MLSKGDHSVNIAYCNRHKKRLSVIQKVRIQAITV